MSRLRDTGFKLAILTVKHHDGFLLYPSRYSKHSVASSSWEDGKGDVVRAFVTSMRKYGLKVGFYLSPADENQYQHGGGFSGGDWADATGLGPQVGPDCGGLLGR